MNDPIEPPPPDTLTLTPAGPDPTTVLGAPGERFVVLRAHAEGGLGRVNVARDQRLGRDVALKEIRPDRRGNAVLRRRFLREAEITARLEHPGVVPVYALEESPDGEPRYAMRFIQGRTLAEAVRAFHAAGADFASLAFRELLTRFVSVCQTVAYAHSKGVVHRDLKPANVMLGDYGETLVVDWGLAKLVGEADEAGGPEGDDSGLTAAGAVLGTPAYMAPEQARGESVGPAADVFALGAILHELLTGQPPYSGGNVEHVVFLAQQGHVVPPPAGRPRPPRALEAIRDRAMALDPAARYPSAQELAADLTRWLADEPVAVYRAPWFERAGRWTRRHPRWTAGLAAGLLVGLVGLAAGLGLFVHFNGQLQAALGEERRAKDFAEQVVYDAMSPWALTFLERQTNVPPEQRAFLERVVEYYQGFVRQDADGATARARRAQAYFNMGFLQHRLGLGPEARAAYEEAIAAYRHLSGAAPDDRGHVRALATSYNNLAMLLQDAGEHEAARAAHEQAAALHRERIAREPDEPLWRRELARTLGNLGSVLRDLGREPAARAASEEARDLLTRLTEGRPDEAEYGLALAEQLNNLGLLHKDAGDQPAARQVFEEGLRRTEAYLKTNPTAPRVREAVARVRYNLGGLLRSAGELEGARTHLVHSLELWRGLVEEFPTVPEYRRGLAMVYTVLGLLAREQNNLPIARQSLEVALALHRQLGADRLAAVEDRRGLAQSHFNLGLVLADQGDPEGARRSYTEALGLQTELVTAFPRRADLNRDAATMRHTLGELLRTQGDRPAARPELDQARAARQKLADEYPQVPGYREDLAATWEALARWHRDERDAPAAWDALWEALELRQKLADDAPDDERLRIELAGTRVAVAQHLRETNNPDRALDEFDRALPPLQAVLARGPHVRAGLFALQALLSRGLLLDYRGRHAEAARDWEAALPLADDKLKATLRARAIRSRARDALTRDLLWPLLWGRPVFP